MEMWESFFRVFNFMICKSKSQKKIRMNVLRFLLEGMWNVLWMVCCYYYNNIIIIII
jgi:hypothetical protein